MKRQTKLAFDMLEKEMERIATEDLPMYKGGTGDGGSSSGTGLFLTSGGIWDTDIYSSGFWDYQNTSGSGDYYDGSSGSSGSGSSGSGSSGSSMDPRQTIDDYVDANGGWSSWTGGYIDGYGYVAPTTTVTASSGGYDVGDAIETGFTEACSAVGLSKDDIEYIWTQVDGKEITSFKFQVDGSYLKILGETASGIDIGLNVMEMLDGDQTWGEDLEDLGQFTLGVIGVATESVGVGFAVDATLAAWEIAEQAGGRTN